MAKPDFLGHFSQLFWGKHACLSTLPQPQPPINALQCTAMHQNSPKCIELCHLNNSVHFSEFQCIAVHCSALMGSWGWGSVLRQACFPHNSWKKWPSKSDLATVVQQSFLLNDAKQAKFPSWWNIPIWVSFPRTGILTILGEFFENSQKISLMFKKH